MGEVGFNKKFWFIVFACSLALLVSFSGKNSSLGIEEFCRKYVLKNMEEVIKHLEASDKLISEGSNSTKKIKQLIAGYQNARKYYKEIEFFIEYYSAFDAKYYINGPLVTKFEIEYAPQVFSPHGFQVIEELLFGESKFDSVALKNEHRLLLSKFSTLKEYYATIIISESNLTEALKLELIRIMSLTLNGYDCTINKENILETQYAINGIINILSTYKNSAPENNYVPLMNSLKNCIKTLKKNPNSDSFNRLSFITKDINPAYKLMIQLFNALNISQSQVNYSLYLKRESVFSAKSLNKHSFSLYISDTLYSAEQAHLGKLLFFDPVLSGNHKRACASCHNPQKGFTDGADKSLAFNASDKIHRNSPTLINSAYQKLFFYDGRAFNLEEQADGVFHSKEELNINSNEIVQKLQQSEEYKLLFKKAFQNRPDSSITFYGVLKSIAEYIKTLDSRNSRFDKYVEGDFEQLNSQEINGYNLFSGKALCGSCHFFPLFNGTVPPLFNENEFEVIGTSENANNKTLDNDIGREGVSFNKIHNRAFKTPSIRNIEITAPYMHNGAYTTLDQILDFYNKGGGIGLNFKLENQTLPFDSLSLSKNELNDIKAFLLSLTDTAGITSKPEKLPAFKQEFLNKRKLGGEY